MPLPRVDKAPFWWFGGKSDAADIIWRALGDVAHYVEPFFGSGAVLLRRPHPPNRAYFSETVNDLDGFIVNFWRAVAADPQAVAEACSWPVIESEMHARHVALIRWMNEEIRERLAGDVTFYDAQMAGWWCWGLNCWIGGEFCAGKGSWWPDETGRLRKRERGVNGSGVNRSKPHIGDNGRGVNHAGAREVGVERKRPHISGNGAGVNQPVTREPGVKRSKPHVSDDGKGVTHAGAREVGVKRSKPHVSDDGNGVNQPQAREVGVERSAPLPSIDEDWQARVEADYVETGGYHPLTMPEIRRWMAWLSARLRHVRVLNGDWSRACTPAVIKTLSVREGRGAAGVFLDPPYAHGERNNGLYRVDQDVAAQVREWCLRHGNDRDMRIVLAGFAGEGHEILVEHGWREVAWFEQGYLKGGMAQRGRDVDEEGVGHQQHRERLWFSPHCLLERIEQQALF